MAHYQVILAYDGTDFAGYQRQKSARTVQGEVEAALKRLGWAGLAILSAGRTDTGVHASGQVIAFDLDWRHAAGELKQALNATLPQDISAREVREREPGFHPRYDARERCYRYTIVCQEERNPLVERFAWRVWPGLQAECLQAAANRLVGTHDFAAFGSPPRPESSTIRTITAAEWQSEGDVLKFVVKANAFLYHMVRRLVYAQVLVGQGKLSLNDLQQGIDAQKALPPGLAPAQGLELAGVFYEDQLTSGDDKRGQDIRP
jgi:tRNA pseudouridine38-40 synthase